MPTVVPCTSGAVSGPVFFPADLARVNMAWPRLPAAIKAAILVLVQAADTDDSTHSENNKAVE